MSNLDAILQRLQTENLHGFCPQPTAPHAFFNASIGSITNSQKEFEADARDPRWFDLFVEYFLEHSDGLNDDLLFFVRQVQPNMDNRDPVFVKRKMPPPNRMPVIDDLILWKETFFLNLIVQLPCKLTMAVCRRTQTDAMVGTGVSSQGSHSYPDLPPAQHHCRYSSLSPDSPASGWHSSSQPSMTCSSKHVSKRVYALPSKQRVDMKDAHWECSYPLIYYVIDDYEDMFEQLIVTEDEYLCVELAVTLAHTEEHGPLADLLNSNSQRPPSSPAAPGNQHGNPRQVYYNDPQNDPFYPKEPLSSASPMLSPRNSIHVMYPEEWSEPFHPPPQTTKITLFQGAVSYQAFLDTYTNRSNSHFLRRFRWSVTPAPTEYIKMRGPGGKGHAQVAVTLASQNHQPLLPGRTDISYHASKFGDMSLGGLGLPGYRRSKMVRKASNSLQPPRAMKSSYQPSINTTLGNVLYSPLGNIGTRSFGQFTTNPLFTRDHPPTNEHHPTDSPVARSKRSFQSKPNFRFWNSPGKAPPSSQPSPADSHHHTARPFWSTSGTSVKVSGTAATDTTISTARLNTRPVHPGVPPRSVPLDNLLHLRRSEDSALSLTFNNKPQKPTLTTVETLPNGSSGGGNNPASSTSTSGSFLQTLRKLTLSSLTENFRPTRNTSPPITPMKCCLTYVSVPWTSIIHDLQAYAGKKHHGNMKL
ncbi:hypothetical protein IWQ61_001702 [Dispira simplex]|nr:hypothetical protein IWQ61_001702 [Dispira simplex]